MKLTSQVKLLPSQEQYAALKQTIETANRACDYISEQAWDTGTFRQYDLHQLTYRAVRGNFNLSAQVVVRCIAKVADAYKLDQKTRRRFRPHSAIAYDQRILRWKVAASEVSIWTVAGRQTIPFVCGEHQRILLQTQQGESDLALVDGVFYLFATCNAEEPAPVDIDGILGVDMGIKNIAVDSDGEVFSGGTVNGLRHRHRRLRAKLQSKGTKSAKRLLKKRGQKESRFACNTNHCISKRLVAKAEGTNRAIAVEELTGIRTRITARRSQRATQSSWAFAQLRSFIAYKAALAGIPMIAVDPRNTSRTCPACGYISKANRSDQSTFSCVSCGFAGLADHIAAVNISRVAVNRPNAATFGLVASHRL
jgi:IS605 OrfB family transposase